MSFPESLSRLLLSHWPTLYYMPATETMDCMCGLDQLAFSLELQAGSPFLEWCVGRCSIQTKLGSASRERKEWQLHGQLIVSATGRGQGHVFVFSHLPPPSWLAHKDAQQIAVELS